MSSSHLNPIWKLIFPEEPALILPRELYEGQAKYVLELIKRGIDTPEKMKAHLKLVDNYHEAEEHIPQTLFPVNMLYIGIVINDIYVTAFVDTGAQISLMNVTVAGQCNILGKINQDQSTTLVGVGTKKTVGKIFYQKVQIGDAELGCAFTVVEEGFHVIIGLDLLWQHRCQIDLDKRVIRFGAHGLVEAPLLTPDQIHDPSRLGETSVPSQDTSEVEPKTESGGSSSEGLPLVEEPSVETSES